MRRAFAQGVGVALAAVGLVGAVFYAIRRDPPPVAETPIAKATTPPQASVYCDFYDFMHASVVVSYDFSVRITNDLPQFAERAEVDAETTRTVYENGQRPLWSYATDDGVPTIAAPDDATRIVLYGLKLKTPGVFWTEAGLRSVRYRNLEGKCRQAHLDVAG